MKKNYEGHCLCKKVSITAQLDEKVGVCHCSMCRQWVGGPFLGVDGGTDAAIRGTEHLGYFVSSDWARRAFCRECGSALFYELRESGQKIISAGLFAKDDGFSLDHQIFIDEKPHWYAFANQTQTMTGAEVFAEFTKQQ